MVFGTFDFLHKGHLNFFKQARKLSAHPFKHGAAHEFSGFPKLVDIYHPSRQNTQTGLLTMGMFQSVLKQARSLAGIV